jgi:hypothetical protein
MKYTTDNNDGYISIVITTDNETCQQIHKWCVEQGYSNVLVSKRNNNSIVATLEKDSNIHREFFEKFILSPHKTKLDEIEVSFQQSILPPSQDQIDFLKTAPIIGTYKGETIHCIYDDPFYIYVIFEDENIKSYFAIYWNKVIDIWSCKQSWTNPKYGRQGLSSLLLEYIILKDKKSPIISDMQMSHMAVGRIHKMIDKGLIKFSILDIETKTILPNEPSIPIYDEKVSDHVVASSDERFRYVWIMEKDELSPLGRPQSSGFIQEMRRDFKPNP